MRLINVKSLKLEEFPENEVVDYVILSHTWGANEISYQQFVSGKRNHKIMQCCTRAVFDGFEYVWVDTCCINKDSSAELSEAINSMYKWYASAAICYAFLEDFPAHVIAGGSGGDPHEVEGALANCRWFTRGWTLQELLAPAVVEFYAADWSEIGTKMSLQGAVSRITSIPVDVLTRAKMPRFYNVAERMSWAARRQTTRLEDEAYCLMGLFDVHMPMIYGEKRRAFRRLQEEILKLHEDYSMFAWPNLPVHYHGSLFAPSPAEFIPREMTFSELENVSPALFQKQNNKETSSSIFTRDRSGSKGDSGKNDHIIPPPSITSRGICVTLPICEWNRPDLPGYNCLAAICIDRGMQPKRPLTPAVQLSSMSSLSSHSNHNSKGDRMDPKQHIIFIQLKRKDRHFRTYIRTHVSVPIKHPSYTELIPQSFGIKGMDASADWLSRFKYETLFVEDHGDSEQGGTDVGADTAVDVRFSSSSASAASTPTGSLGPDSLPGSNQNTPSLPPSISLGPEATCTVSLVKFFDPRRPPFAFDAHDLHKHTFKPFGGLSGVLVFAANASNMSNATSMNGVGAALTTHTSSDVGSGAVSGAPITVSFGARNEAPWCSVVCGKSISDVEQLARSLKLTELLTLAAESEIAAASLASKKASRNGAYHGAAAGGPTSAPAAAAAVSRRATQTDRCRVRLTPRGVNPVFWMDVSIRKGFRPKAYRRTSDLATATRSTHGGGSAQQAVSNAKVEDKFIVHVNVVKDLEIADHISMPPGISIARKAVADKDFIPLGLGKRVSTM